MQTIRICVTIIGMNDYRSVLKNSELKVTPARLSVLSYLEHTKSPLDIDSIYKHISQEHEAVDQATIYRVVETLYKKGIVTRLEFGEGKYRYELHGDDHHHLVCENCGAIEDITDCAIRDLEADITRLKLNY